MKGPNKEHFQQHLSDSLIWSGAVLPEGVVTREPIGVPVAVGVANLGEGGLVVRGEGTQQDLGEVLGGQVGLGDRGEGRLHVEKYPQFVNQESRVSTSMSRTVLRSCWRQQTYALRTLVGG